MHRFLFTSWWLCLKFVSQFYWLWLIFADTVFLRLLPENQTIKTTPHIKMSEINLGIFGSTSTYRCNLPLHVSSPLPQHNSSYQQPATPQMIPEGGQASNSCLSEENQQQPSQAPTQPQPQGTTQEPGGYMLTPNAPVLYGSAYSPFEKPPPYACWAQRQTSGACWKRNIWSEWM